ncbi:MAG: tRNA guanosine(34) transglycosylase Tgt [Bacteroidetes bacterium]|nr:tRNA guanosine(34) transglycosylase Tgt [Bacteroidota bacterium]
MNNDFFKVLYNSSEAGVKCRTGLIKTAGSEFETPVFMPVGTLGNVKALEQRELLEFDTGIILANTYHLFLRPGTEVLENAGGLHKFMNWDRSLLTDSGGFQVFSLAKLRKISEEGVEFSSHLNGDKCFFTPDKVIDIQRSIGSDIMMPLDECLPYPCDYERVKKSIGLTFRWEKKCFEHFSVTESRYGRKQFLFSINQGSTFRDLRKESIEMLSEIDFDGNAIGGLAVGEENSIMYDTADHCTELMSKDKPRYLMGVGTPVDLLECVERGVDMFDCVMPTRNARHGRLFTTNGEINLKSARLKFDNNSPDEGFLSYTSKNFSLAYLRHLFISNEMLGFQLATIHNVGFYINLMKNIREAIRNDSFKSFKKDFLEKYLRNGDK